MISASLSKAVLAFSFTSLCAFTAFAQAPTAAIRFDQIEQVITGFQDSQHLYIQGELGISDEQLSALEMWLDNNAPHWTIVLMQRGAGQTYHAPDGRTFNGMDAVEFALGHGLANRTQFGRLEHPKTGETDGATFVLFLEDRKFSYYASDAQDRRSLGEAQWIGNLDRNARMAMQNGGRIIDAVKNTVIDINERLAQNIAAEEQAERDRIAAVEQAKREKIAQEERIKRERERAVAQVKAELLESRTKLLPEIESLASDFIKNFPEAIASVLARPPLSEWKAELDNFEATLSEDNSREVSQSLAKTLANIHRQIDFYSAHATFEQTLAPLEQRWRGLTLHRYSNAAETQAVSAQDLIRRARTEYLRGDVAFIVTIERIRKDLGLGETAIFAAITKDQQDAARRQVIRRTILTMLGIAFVVISTLLWFLYRRRRPSLAAAHQLFSDCQQRYQIEQALIETIHTRKKAILGTLESFTKRGKIGDTLQLAQQIETECVDIQALITSARQVFTKVEKLITPTEITAKLANLFTPTRYLQASNLLASSVFEMSRSNRGHLDAASKETPMNDKAINPSSRLVTLERFLTETSLRRKTAEQKLNHIEHASSTVHAALSDLESKYLSLGEQARAVAAQASQDRYFSVTNFEAMLLPSIRRSLDRGRKMAEIDPVHVMDNLCPTVSRQLTESNDGIAFIKDVREKQFPIFDEVGEKLKSLKHRVQWIEEHVILIGDRLNQLIQDSCTREVKEDLKQLGADANAFLTKLQTILEVANTTISDRCTEVQTVRQSLSEARSHVAANLAIKTTDAIAEDDLNPDNSLSSAEAAIGAARVAIDMGNLEDAIRATHAAQEETKYAQSLVVDSLQALTRFKERYTRVCQDLENATKSLADVTEIVNVAEQNYAPTALIWHEASENQGDHEQADDPEHDHDPWTPAPFATGEPISMQVESANRITESIRTSLGDAPEKHALGKVLEAANILRFAEEGTAESTKRLELAKSHCKRLDALVPANIRRAESLCGEMTKLKDHIEDSRSEVSTQETYRQLQNHLDVLTTELRTSRPDRDPFLDTEQLLKQRIAIIELRATLKADYQAFEEAKLEVEGARRELKAVARLAMQSIEDQVPDSAEISHCQDETRRISPLVSAAEVALKVPHSDWQAIQKTASDLTSELAMVSGSLSQELRSAQEAAIGLRTASSEVSRASRWSGAYGISISVHHGSHELEEARRALANGDYAAAISFSGNAVSAAESAIRTAQDEVESRRRQAEIEAQRRRARQQSVFSSSSGSSFGSSSSSRSWSSHSSSSSSSRSFSSSSSSSSGGSSGFSRSGW